MSVIFSRAPLRISLGGGGGTAIATAGMRALPLGFPKLMVSTLASGQTAHYVGVKDIVMMPSIVDVAGLNRISRQILTRAAGAICGMVEAQPPSAQDRPIIVASMFGNTTDCVQQAKKILESAGYEDLRREQASRRENGGTRQLGIGMSAYVEVTNGISESEFGGVEITDDTPTGAITAFTGTASTPPTSGIPSD